MPKSTYQIKLTADARADFKRLDNTVAERIWKKLDALVLNIETFQHTALKGQWSTSYKLRVGDYRVIYKLDHANAWLIVISVGHRSSVYHD